MIVENKDTEAEETTQDSRSQTQAQQMTKLVSESEAQLFHDQFNSGYFAPYGNGRQIFKIRARQCRNWLVKLFWENTGKTLSSNTLQSVIQLLEAKACFNGPLYTLHIRVAMQDDVYWYDLGDGIAVKITSESWEIAQDPPILFRKFSHQKPQIEPKRGGKVEELLSFLNLRYDDGGKLSGEQLLILCWLVFGLVPNLPHPSPILNGGQGSKKTTFLKVLKALLDPSSVETKRAPAVETEFMQTASHHLFLILDNVTSLPSWLSDSICSIITGAGYSKRELFTDDDDIFYSFKHLVGINGINLVVEKADLLERSLIFSLTRNRKFKTERVFWTQFEKRKPYLLGAMFDTLVKTLQLIKNASEPEGEFRMADFVHWGSAIAQALGYKSEDFINAYKVNINNQNTEALDASPVGTCVIYFMSDQENWSGSPTELLSEFEKIAEKLKINQKSKAWPKDPRWLWRRINEVLPNLEDAGIKAERNKQDSRLIILEKFEKNDDNNGGNDNSNHSANTQVDIKDNTDNISESSLLQQEKEEIDPDELPF